MSKMTKKEVKERALGLAKTLEDAPLTGRLIRELALLIAALASESGEPKRRK
jgi:hypothetical protein